MRKPSIALLVAASIALLPVTAVRADCAYKMSDLQAHLAGQTDKAKIAAVRKELDKARAARPTSETECLNAVTRGWRALRAPSEVPARAPNTPMNIPDYGKQN